MVSDIQNTTNALQSVEYTFPPFPIFWFNMTHCPCHFDLSAFWYD